MFKFRFTLIELFIDIFIFYSLYSYLIKIILVRIFENYLQIFSLIVFRAII